MKTVDIAIAVVIAIFLAGATAYAGEDSAPSQTGTAISSHQDASE